MEARERLHYFFHNFEKNLHTAVANAHLPRNMDVIMKKDLLTSTFELLRTRLFIKARTLLADDEEARDLLQDAFFRLWQARIDFDGERHAAGLITTTVRNMGIDRLRRRATRAETALNENSDYPETGTADSEQSEIFHRVERLAAEHLSTRDREILFRRDRDEWSFEDIAEHYGTTPANVRLIVARARRKLRTLYTKQNYD